MARRRLLRGTFAAPAVMTLCSASALAAASNRRCIANQVGYADSALKYPPASASTDTWIRVQLWTLSQSTLVTPANDEQRQQYQYQRGQHDR